MMATKQIKCVLIGLLSASLLACSGDNSDLLIYINKIKSRPAMRIEPIPKFAPLPIFKFPEDDKRRSPFKQTTHDKIDNLAPDQNRKKQPLEAFPLDALKFVGTLRRGGEIWALIQQPDGKVTRAHVGDYMGQNYGKITLVKDNLLKIEETIRDSGKWKKQVTTVNLDQNLKKSK